MGEIWVRELTGGLDTRRMAETTKGGALVLARDGHINSGGEFEQRAAFVKQYTLLDGTVSLATGALSLYAFGHLVAPVMPSGVVYQRLQHPDGLALTRVLSYDLYGGLIYAIGEFADGSVKHFYDGVLITAWFDGRGRASFKVTGGTASPASQLSTLTVDGVAIIGSAVVWATSNEHTAALIAAEINSKTSVPEYSATAVGTQVNIIATVAGAAANGRVVISTVSNGLVLTPTGGTLAQGADTTGTFTPGAFAKTMGSKVYSVSGSNLHFSGVDAPTGWTTDSVGAGFIDMAKQASGMENLVGIGEYQNNAAVFAERVILVEYIDPDPTLNRRLQVLRNTGTGAARSICGFGDADLFYLDESGVRSLRARDASNTAATNDVGVPIDSLVKAKMATFTLREKAACISLIEPSAGRYWLVTKNEIFVFSLFPGSKVNAWSTYLPTYFDDDGVEHAFNIDDAAVYAKRVYLRSGNNIFVYGGLDLTPQYDATSPEMWTPFLDGDKPSKEKTLAGMDVACEGTWEVHLAFTPTTPDASDKIGTVSRSTFNEGRLTAVGKATHVSIRFKGVGSGAKKISSALIHYTSADDED